MRDFHNKFELLVNKTPIALDQPTAYDRFMFMREELMEFHEAAQKGDLAEAADALIDIVYVAKGTAVMMGLPWKQLWEDVQRANMEKVKVVQERGTEKELYHVFVTKPPGWNPPRTKEILGIE